MISESNHCNINDNETPGGDDGANNESTRATDASLPATPPTATTGSETRERDDLDVRQILPLLSAVQIRNPRNRHRLLLPSSSCFASSSCSRPDEERSHASPFANGNCTTTINATSSHFSQSTPTSPAAWAACNNFDLNESLIEIGANLRRISQEFESRRSSMSSNLSSNSI